MFWPCPQCRYRNLAHHEACSSCGAARPYVQAEPRTGPRFVKQNAKPATQTDKPKPDQPNDPGHYSYY